MFYRTPLTFLFVFFLSISNANAIVNLGSLHLGEKQKGFIGDISLGLSGASGHSEQFRVKSGANAQWSLENSLYYISFNYKYGESGGVEDQNKGFVHARKIKSISNNLAWEVFSQIEHNKFARLNFRGLLGGGARYEISGMQSKHITFFGLGGFYSREDLTNLSIATDNGIEDTWRGNIYLLERVSFKNNISIFETLYYQPSIAGPKDFRLLNILGIKTSLTKTLSLSFSLEATHDSEPPQGVVKTDLNYFTSIEYSF